MKLDGCTALITGASAGIGREFARQLAGRAGALVLVARRIERLEQLRDELTQRHPNLHVHVRAVDLADAEQVRALCEWLERERIEIDVLINNAGIGDHGLFVNGDPAKIDRLLQVNMVALTNLTRTLLPAMLARRRGGILNVSSSAGFIPMTRLGVYAASKAYVTSFSEALRLEVRGSGVNVSALCPGPVATEFNALAKRPDEPAERAPAFTYVSVEEVASAGLRGLERNQAVVVPGLLMKLVVLLLRATPMPMLRFAMRFY